MKVRRPSETEESDAARKELPRRNSLQKSELTVNAKAVQDVKIFPLLLQIG